MKFDPEGHIEISPRDLFDLAQTDKRRLIDHGLIQGTPHVFPTYDLYCAFLQEISSRFEVHPRNLILRGSSKLGFSIAPRVGKVWYEVREDSDLDLAIVDAAYYERIDQEVIRWEERNRVDRFSGRATQRFEERQQDRFFNCCRVKDLPRHLFLHHFDAIEDIARMAHCGHKREMNAFIYRDWWALRARFEFDLRELCDRVPTPLSEPPERPIKPATQQADRPSTVTAPAPPREVRPSSPPLAEPEILPGGSERRS